ncbi:MAG TPA: hypothetical protein VJC00_00435 [Candidatus Nanoarchaeia archaeon]|nr:hypothetical protein [Candidatus Nanoarchaeia archaeon]
MALKCDICSSKIENNFLNKAIGTYLKDNKGKKHLICPACQKKFRTKEEILKNI